MGKSSSLLSAARTLRLPGAGGVPDFTALRSKLYVDSFSSTRFTFAHFTLSARLQFH